MLTGANVILKINVQESIDTMIFFFKRKIVVCSWIVVDSVKTTRVSWSLTFMIAFRYKNILASITTEEILIVEMRIMCSKTGFQILTEYCFYVELWSTGLFLRVLLLRHTVDITSYLSSNLSESFRRTVLGQYV